MQTALKRVFISFAVTILCVLTLVATTFAWVGIFTSSEFDDFEINLNSSDFKEYGIELSLTGESGTFSSSINQIELKKIILKNCGKDLKYLQDDNSINYEFNKLRLDSCSPQLYSDNTFSEFYDIYNYSTRKYFKFDIYISTFKAYETNTTSDYYLDAYLYGELFKGNIGTANLINEFIYPSNFVNNATNGIKANTRLKDNLSVDSSSACRVSFQKYNVVEKGHPELYDNYEIINDCIIYQGGTAMPTYDEENKLYSFGGILKEEYNVALKEYNKKFRNNRKTLPSWALNRGDIEYKESEYNQIIDSSNSNEKIGINDMMKITICFWFEGWDSDCFEAIDSKPVTLNINFTNNID